MTISIIDSFLNFQKQRDSQLTERFLAIMQDMSARHGFSMHKVENMARINSPYFPFHDFEELGINVSMDDFGGLTLRRDGKEIYIEPAMMKYADKQLYFSAICTVFGVDLFTGKRLEETKEAFLEVDALEVDAEDVPPLRCCICGEKLPVVLVVGTVIVACPACDTVFDMIVTEKKITLELKV